MPCTCDAVGLRDNGRMRFRASWVLALTQITVLWVAVCGGGESRGQAEPAWVAQVGAVTRPADGALFPVRGAKGDGVSVVTDAIQGAIDAAGAAGGGKVTLEPGVYLSGPLFLRSGVHLRVDAGVTLLAVPDEAAYPRQPTRVAGIEMPWPVAFINVAGAERVAITGDGVIDGNGELWWAKYWKMRHDDYEPRGLRWAVDYDCERVRLLVVSDSTDVTVQGVHLRRAGFWTVQVLYSKSVTIDGLTIRDNGGPSTDGVDIDSSTHVLVQNCDIDNNDDCICLKSGRDFDGLRVNRPTEYVVLRNNLTRSGGGILSFGSETSGGIQHIYARGNRGIGTREGLRFKSARTRGGFVRDVAIYDTVMENVPLPLTFTLNWNPSYSYASIPAGVSPVPEHWKTMNTPVVPVERGLTDFSDIVIDGVKATGAKKILSASGLPTKPLSRVTLAHIDATGASAGSIEHTRDWVFDAVAVTVDDGQPLRVTESAGVRGEVRVAKPMRAP